VGHDQRGRRLRDHRPDAQDVQEERGRQVMGLVASLVEGGSGMDVRTVVYRVSLLVASLCFLVGLRMLTNPETARRGMQVAVVGMVLGVLGTLVHREIITYWWIIGGLVIGTVVGVPMGLLIPMTKMPERIALS